MTGDASSTVGGWSRVWYDEWPQTRSGSELSAPRKTEQWDGPQRRLGPAEWLISTSPRGHPSRSWANPSTAENSVGQSFPPDVAGFDRICPLPHLRRRDRSACRPLAVGRKAPASDGKLPLEDQPVRCVAGLRSDLPGSESRESEKTCGSSRGTESSWRWLARIGFPAASREKLLATVAAAR